MTFNAVLTTAILGAFLSFAAGGALAQTTGPVTAAIMIVGGEKASCELGNVNAAYVVRLATQNGPVRYVDGWYEQCFVLPITSPVGTQVRLRGWVQDLLARQPPPAPTAGNPPVTEDCFNVEAYTVGLTADAGSEFDPAADVIDPQGYGFAWYASDSGSSPGPSYSYVVGGCAGGNCPLPAAAYNTDGSTATCAALPPYPDFAQRPAH